jgi:hypothetical protein
MPPLYGADLRLRRARRQLSQLGGQVERFQKAHESYLGTVPDSNDPGGAPLFGLTKMDNERMAGLSIKAGEIIYNLRSALNYSIYELSRNGTTGKGHRWAQFPIETRKDTWKLRVTGRDARGERKPKQWWLKGVPASAVDAIRIMQPPPVGTSQWSKDLQDLPNSDKHMHLMGLRTNIKVWIKGHEVIESDTQAGEKAARLYFDAEIDEIALPDERPLVDTLQTLYAAVVDAVGLLKTCIEPR